MLLTLRPETCMNRVDLVLLVDTRKEAPADPGARVIRGHFLDIDVKIEPNGGVFNANPRNDRGSPSVKNHFTPNSQLPLQSFVYCFERLLPFLSYYG